ncbi:PREDICTED: lysosomal Pro-X carboxypeptidase [Acromyrmex echinatior]|uniref:Lysosomal Pro-X carboxypeptidase n=1 Tax=Acromyrmex echinatior TaxID=103372 RepID=F4WIB0_ACREC|nr:PREDICTED: lysosomal Pro-X carboxypeptidase [Acromyrmex echinatior]EGI66041.1 Lysosomal Pro-X carboxypeptidase [Acromyrmex echinatior]
MRTLLLLCTLIMLCWSTIQLRSEFAANWILNHHAPLSLLSARYKYEIKTFDVRVDHFSFAVQDTFKLRYLINDTWRKQQNAPIFFYTGNEGNIEVFAQNTGFLWEIAPKFDALVIFAEHRYYGESLPYGNQSFANLQHRGYLTSQQALADYVELIAHLKSQPRYEHSPVIVFGGSYGGMLSAWMRMKYPHVVQGAIASSAPLLQFTDVVDCEVFARITTSDYKAANPTCSKLIQKSWNTITNVTSNDEGKKWLSDNWKLCEPLKTAEDVKTLKNFLQEVYIDLAMVNYPYETNFLAPLPGNPINVFCQHLTNVSLTGKPLLLALHGAISVYTNYTGKTNCISMKNAEPGLDDQGWDYQACTEMVMPICTDGINDMFEPVKWNITDYNNICFKKYSVSPQPYLVCEEYGCKNFNSASNIIFSNGLLDPWASGGVLRNLSQSAIAILMPDAAHHLDLRETNSNDPYSVRMTRKFHQFWIYQWIREY